MQVASRPQIGCGAPAVGFITVWSVQRGSASPAAPPPVRASSTAAAAQWVVARHCRTASEALPSAAPPPLLVMAMAMAMAMVRVRTYCARPALP